MVTDSNEVRHIALAASSFLAHLRRPGNGKYHTGAITSLTIFNDLRMKLS
jgi:hypothetical protein